MPKKRLGQSSRRPSFSPWRLGPNLRLLAQPWIGPLLALVVVVIGGAVGYRITEGWDWGDCFWMVLITISTIGYGEVEPLSHAGRLVTVLIIAGGIVVVQLTIQRILGLTEAGYFRQLRALRFRRKLRRMHDHVIICGYGRIGREIGEQLLQENIAVLVVELDPQRSQAAQERGLRVLEADATGDETLLEAGLNRCRSLVAALPSDAANLYVVLSARGLQPNCRLIARSDSEEAAAKLKLAGASVVVSPYVAGGRVMAASALRPLAVDFMELLVGSDCEIEEFQLSNNPLLLHNLPGQTLADLQLGRRSGAFVLAIRDKGRLVANPGGDMRLEAGQLLVVLGSKEQLMRFRELLGPAVDMVETMGGSASG
ncbi:TrkA family potassium uptake protein [Synechococcus sp. UW105]|mgnify:CR=1 FL=1|jgi:voltage-gated potassium channel|uniref:potassium channel family protein n=1 Tax=unclassified Synechococcus TaxID=2626047 RepID=UPI000C933A00|nr:potassium channel protein [Synechococcus sp. UW105]MAS26767.1 VIC family potassium channel protein [Synechococcus sp. NAT40]RZO13717.1 MAG: potassium channel protein [Synechococcus sp. MED-G135]